MRKGIRHSPVFWDLPLRRIKNRKEKMRKAYLIAAALMALTYIQPALAQKAKEKPDSYYLLGAVPEENGKVVFSKQFSIPAMSQEEISNRSKAWMESWMEEHGEGSQFMSQETGNLVSFNNETMIFHASSMSTDKGIIHYMLTVSAENGSCQMRMTNITYNDKELGRIPAEEWISDKEALTKKQDKMFPGVKKWRRGTVDLYEELADGLKVALSIQQSGQPAARTAQEKATETTVISQKEASAAVKADESESAKAQISQSAQDDSQIDVQSLNSNMISASKGSLLAGEDEIEALQGGYLSHEGSETYLTLMFQPTQNVSSLEGKQEMDVLYKGQTGNIRLHIVNVSLEGGTRGRPYMLIGEIKSAVRE